MMMNRCVFSSLSCEVCTFCCDHYLFKRGILGKKPRSPSNASGGVPISDHCQCKRLQTWWSEREIENRCKKDSLLNCFQMVPWTVCRCCSSSCSHLVFCDCIFGLLAGPKPSAPFPMGSHFCRPIWHFVWIGKSNNNTVTTGYLFFLWTPAGSADQQPHFFSFRQFTFSSADPNRINVHREVQMVSPTKKKEAVECSWCSPETKGVQPPCWILQRKIWLSFLINSNDKT